MKNYIAQLFVLSLLVLNTACEDNRMNYMVADKVYLNTPGFSEATLFNWGDFSYDLIVIKGGKGQQGANVKLNISESFLGEYNARNNTQYKMLPAEYYKVASDQITFGKDDYRSSFRIQFATASIAELQKSSTDKYVLPCLMTIQNASIEAADSARMGSIISPVVKEPYLQLQDIGLLSSACMLAPDAASLNEQLIYSRVETNYFNQWDLTYALEIDPLMVETYNTANNTDYKVLPEEVYEINKDLWNIPAKRDDQYIEIKIKKKGLVTSSGEHLFGDYVLPIKLASVSKHGIDPARSELLYPVTYHPSEIVRTGFKISDCSSESIGEGFGKENVLDGNMKTYWQNLPESTLPDTITMDMLRERTLMGLELSRPEANKATRTVEFEISKDSINYEPLTTFDFGSTATVTIKNEMSNPKVARFLRCIVTASNSGSKANIAEIKIKGLRSVE